jgi:hypothetical protein
MRSLMYSDVPKLFHYLDQIKRAKLEKQIKVNFNVNFQLRSFLTRYSLPWSRGSVLIVKVSIFQFKNVLELGVLESWDKFKVFNTAEEAPLGPGHSFCCSGSGIRLHEEYDQRIQKGLDLLAAFLRESAGARLSLRPSGLSGVDFSNYFYTVKFSNKREVKGSYNTHTSR